MGARDAPQRVRRAHAVADQRQAVRIGEGQGRGVAGAVEWVVGQLGVQLDAARAGLEASV